MEWLAVWLFSGRCWGSEGFKGDPSQMVRMLGEPAILRCYGFCLVLEREVWLEACYRGACFMFPGILFSTSYFSSVAVVYVTKHGGCEKDGNTPQYPQECRSLTGFDYPGLYDLRPFSLADGWLELSQTKMKRSSLICLIFQINMCQILASG